MSGIVKPKRKIIGCDVAGIITAIGGKVTKFKIGDEVFGDLSGGNWGGFAEYVCGRENELAIKPAGMTFEDAAALPQAGVLALQGIRHKENIQAGQKVLINGAGGGVGTLGIQMLKMHDVEITGVDRADKLDMLRSIGVDHVIDYAKEDYTKNGERYDLIIDVVAHRSVFDYKRTLNTNGVFVVVGGSIPRILQVAFLGSWISKASGKKMGLLMHRPNPGDLEYLCSLYEAGKLVPIIDKRFTLNQVSEAMQYFGEGHFVGKIVITIAE
jgi:NADPH:quinone reductase-like Zn-dependent oxidoreductase